MPKNYGANCNISTRDYMDRSHHFFITIHRYKVPGLANVLKLDTANDGRMVEEKQAKRILYPQLKK
jgi:hypothetical protein